MNQMQLITSKIDTRDHKLLRLNNGLKCLIVSDPQSEKAAAALSVNIGGFYVPKEYPGLAHFLEHMLFFGSHTYPDEKYYTEFITQHGGESNAYTSTDETTYHFDINADNFEHALDIFSHFFIDPIFNEEMILREVNAVDSEFYGNYNNDSYRLHQIMNSLIDGCYPVTNFNCGNKTTLHGEQLFNKMIEFYNDYYSADQMVLAIISNKPLEILEKIIVSKFSQIKRHDNFIHPKDSIQRILLPYTNFLNKNKDIPLIRVVPLGAKKKITLYWQLPSSYTDYQCKQEQYWSNIIGHEGPNSLLSCLKNMSYATSLSAASNINPLFDLFEISMVLTEHGNNNIEKIVTVVFQFIEKMQKLCDQDLKQLYDECKRISQINFDNKSKEDPESYALSLINNMYRYKDIHVLSGDSHYDAYDATVLTKLKEYMNHIYFSKPIIVHLNKNYEGNLDGTKQKQEQYYHTQYQIDWVPVATFSDFTNLPTLCNKMNAPPPNIFIPDDLSLIDSSFSKNMEVIQLNSSKNGELWYQCDVQFKQPKININFEVLLPKSLNTVNDKIFGDLYALVLNEIINEHLYSAALMNNYYMIEIKNKLHLNIYGYSDKLLNVWFTVLNAINGFECDSQLFCRIIENEKRKYQMFQSSNTVSQAMYHVKDTFIKNTVFYKDALQFLDNVTLDDLIQYEKNMYTNCYYIGYICGNISLELCGKFHSMFQELIKSKSSLNDCAGIVAEEFNPFLNPTFENSVVSYEPFNEKELDVNSSSVVLFDFGNEHMNNHKNAVLSLILEIILNDAFFDQLRTKQQLGYCVQCTRYQYDYLNKNKSGLMFVIQSSSHDSEYLQQQINEFISHIFDFLTQNSFDQVVKSLIIQLSEPFQRLNSMANYYFSEILEKSYSFNSREMKIRAAEETQFIDFIQYVNTMILNNNNKLTINVN